MDKLSHHWLMPLLMALNAGIPIIIIYALFQVWNVANPAYAFGNETLIQYRGAEFLSKTTFIRFHLTYIFLFLLVFGVNWYALKVKSRLYYTFMLLMSVVLIGLYCFQ